MGGWPPWLSVLGTAISGVLAVVGAVASAIEIRNFVAARRIRRVPSSKLPLRVSKALRYSEFEDAIRLTVKVLDDLRFQPDCVVGIHYTGLSYAALLAKELYVPIRHVEVNYSDTGGHHMVDEVTLRFDAGELSGKRVLVVDNRMATGNTMKVIRDKLRDAGATVKTMVFYRHSYENSVIVPDIVLFTSTKPLERLVD